jgi:hypothetical protein
MDLKKSKKQNERKLGATDTHYTHVSKRLVPFRLYINLVKSHGFGGGGERMRSVTSFSDFCFSVVVWLCTCVTYVRFSSLDEC